MTLEEFGEWLENYAVQSDLNCDVLLHDDSAGWHVDQGKADASFDIVSKWREVKRDGSE